MFFRRARPKIITYQERLQMLRDAGFAVTAVSGGHRVERAGCAAVIGESGGQVQILDRAGIVMGQEIARLVDGGYQKFFQAPSGKRQPALAGELGAIHDFQEDLREALGLTSLYNESLGTVSNLYLYDRLRDRDHGVPKRPWEQ